MKYSFPLPNKGAAVKAIKLACELARVFANVEGMCANLIASAGLTKRNILTS